jgi:hypothetical protein
MVDAGLMGAAASQPHRTVTILQRSREYSVLPIF